MSRLQAKIHTLQEAQVMSGMELRPFFARTLMPSILDEAVRGES